MVYVGVHGNGGSSRLILYYCNVDFDDYRMTMEEYLEKEGKGCFPNDVPIFNMHQMGVSHCNTVWKYVFEEIRMFSLSCSKHPLFMIYPLDQL